MADKSFGVKELNLLNASGTPTITSPNNLNLNANTVAISTSVTIGQNLTVSANAGIASLNVTGVSTFAGITTVSGDTLFTKQLSVTGVITATSFVGDGSGLTGISAGISTSPSNVQATWKLGGGSGSGFTFTGPGQDGSEGNPDIYLVRGQRYLFDNTTLAGNHPFEFRNAANNADYTDGVSGAQNGLQYINVQHDAPARLKYRCTIHTNSMLGNIYIIGGEQVIAGDVTLQGASGKNFLWDNSAEDLYLNDNGSGASAKLKIGSGGDLQLYHDVGGVNHIVCATNQELKLSANQFSFYDYTGVSRRALLDSNGDLGLGIAAVPQDSGARTLHIHDSDTGSAARAAIRLTHGSSGSTASNGAFIGFDNNPDFYLYNQENGNLRFGTNGSERFRVDTGGRVQIGTTSAIQNSLLTLVSGNGVRVLVCQSGGIGANDAILFRNPNGDVGRIVTTGSSTSYNISSDYRLKENLVAISDGITRLKTLKPYRFNFIKTPDTTVDGFLAHEVTAVPEAITGTKDEVDSDNNPVYQGIDQSKLVPLLTAALQEAITKIETLEAKVAALEGS